MNGEVIEERGTMNGKPVFVLPAKAVINFKSGFREKLLCDGPTFSTGVACPYSCSFCYVPSVYRKILDSFLKERGLKHEEVVIRREDALGIMERQLTDSKGRPKFLSDPNDRRVIYASPATDVAANLALVRETVEACKLILRLTNWQIRLLSKSHLLPNIAHLLDNAAGFSLEARKRIIYGVSTGTLDDKLARAFEEGTPLVSKRIEALHWLQDNGFRTFGMLCPSLPTTDGHYDEMARGMHEAIRPDRCEHVWAEVINVRGESFTRTRAVLLEAGYVDEAAALAKVSTDGQAWEQYSRATFLAHAALYRDTGKLRFLQYVTKMTRPWWEAQVEKGAVLL